MCPVGTRGPGMADLEQRQRKKRIERAVKGKQKSASCRLALRMK